MGPLFTHDIISNEWNLLIGFLIGISFGFILEQAGFSSARRIVGTFYGYDMTVLKVFFTAAMTSMLGLIIFNYMGWMDLDLRYVFVNPTFLWSAIIGGIIMGAGMAIGGFCPGTSVCAIGIGKIDAIIFVIGTIIGVFVFATIYPLVEGIFKGFEMGQVTIPEFAGISNGLFALIMIVVAVGAFFVAEWAEKKFARPDISEEL
ncbi:MAG: YeeE/YedE family protein [Bacteroidales bacterium]|nr:YeeE/YedE family protein [Bacteroidales bacterium]